VPAIELARNVMPVFPSIVSPRSHVIHDSDISGIPSIPSNIVRVPGANSSSPEHCEIYADTSAIYRSTNAAAFSPLANYTDRAAAGGRRS
jgi:hypothetical protein